MTLDLSCNKFDWFQALFAVENYIWRGKGVFISIENKSGSDTEAPYFAYLASMTRLVSSEEILLDQLYALSKTSAYARLFCMRILDNRWEKHGLHFNNRWKFTGIVAFLKHAALVLGHPHAMYQYGRYTTPEMYIRGAEAGCVNALLNITHLSVWRMNPTRIARAGARFLTSPVPLTKNAYNGVCEIVSRADYDDNIECKCIMGAVLPPIIKKWISRSGFPINAMEQHQRAKATYKHNAACTRAIVDAWTLCARRMRIARDVRILIARLVWATRFEGLYG